MERNDMNQDVFKALLSKAYEKEYKEKLKDSKTTQTIASTFSQYKQKARDYLANAQELENFLVKVEKKLKQVPKVGDKLAYVPQMILLVRSYAIGEYREISKTELVLVLAALIYFVSPVDFVPDKIPFAGILDDALVIGVVVKHSQGALKAYMKWLESKPKAEKVENK